MNAIDIQNYACKLAFDIVSDIYKGEKLYKVFPLYEMIIEDFYYRQKELIDKELEEYFSTFVEIKNIASSDAQEFYVSSCFGGE